MHYKYKLNKKTHEDELKKFGTDLNQLNKKPGKVVSSVSEGEAESSIKLSQQKALTIERKEYFDKKPQPEKRQDLAPAEKYVVDIDSHYYVFYSYMLKAHIDKESKDLVHQKVSLLHGPETQVFIFEYSQILDLNVFIFKVSISF